MKILKKHQFIEKKIETVRSNNMIISWSGSRTATTSKDDALCENS